MSNYAKCTRRGASNEGTGWQPLYPLEIEGYAAGQNPGLRWTVPTPMPVDYEVQCNYQYGGWHWVATVPGNLSEWVDTSLVHGGDNTALYLVRPRWLEGNVAWSNEVTVEELKSAP